MDVSAGNRSLRMPQERGDRRFGETKIVGRACETMAQDMGSDARQRRALKHFLPMFWKADERFAFDRSREHGPGRKSRAAAVQEFERRQSDRADRSTLFAVEQSKATACVVYFQPG